ncbi:hypothetical protein [Trujillonella endophytica]|uniref:Uncharacterized protein n=1 Tax=Trujillonella endophytica TaxID=673521 RepID=A0A1H8WQY0_9ACTN|nr:hypothetical protein [Trujillella endophytica]SEP29498.1 hypothetical protein SAMN05660991_04603 [Trujillella endophytica]
MPKFDESALSSFRAFAAETATACAVERLTGTEATVRGGRRKGADVIDAGETYLVDAKVLTPTTAAERREWPGCSWKFVRQDHAPFSGELTHIGLVQLDQTATHAGITSGRLIADAGVTDTVVSLVPVATMNADLDPVGGAEHGWRYVLVDDALLAAHVVP